MTLKKFFFAAIFAAASFAFGEGFYRHFDFGVGGQFAFGKVFQLSSDDGFEKMHSADVKWSEIGIPLKLNFWNFFGEKKIAGLQVAGNFVMKFDHAKAKDKYGNDSGEMGTLFSMSGDFFAGPAFGFDVGNNGGRFQTGLCFHFMWGGSDVKKHSVTNVTASGQNYPSEIKEDDTMLCLGLALTPQFRFNTSKRLCVVAGCDLIFDFSNLFRFNYIDKSDFVELHVDEDNGEKFFRFAFAPYIALGVNF